MQPEKFTQKSQEALQEAQRLAREHSHQEIDGEHLALALIGQTESLIPELLERIGVPVARLKPDLEAELARRHKVQGAGDAYAGARFAKGARRRAIRGDQAQGRLRQHRTSAARPAGQRRPVAEKDFRQARPQARRRAQGARRIARQPARDRRKSRSQIPGARKIRPRPHRAGAAGQD